MQNDSIYLEDFKKEEESFSVITENKKRMLVANNYDIFINKSKQVNQEIKV